MPNKPPPPPELVKKWQELAAALTHDAEKIRKAAQQAEAADKLIVEVDNANK